MLAEQCTEAFDSPIDFSDIAPRLSVTYDLFGNGKTALKVSMSKYLQAAFNGDVYTISNPAVTLQQTTSRGWTDANQNFVAECDFLNPAANGECQAWTAGSDDHRQPRRPGRLGQTQLGLAVQRRHSARSAATRVAGCELQPPLVGQLLRQHP
jgi:hypothetical protein